MRTQKTGKIRQKESCSSKSKRYQLPTLPALVATQPKRKRKRAHLKDLLQKKSSMKTVRKRKDRLKQMSLD